MYVGVDIGGTKTLVATLDGSGVITEKIKLATPKDYPAFLEQLRDVAGKISHSDSRAGCIAVPGRVDRDHGIGEYFGSLSWQHVPIQADTEAIFHCPILIENDANLGALSESKLLPSDKRVLYITISTGIGTGFTINQEIAPVLADSEGGQMLLEYHGKRMPWEDFASGRAIVERFGKKAADITDDITWKRIAYDISLGVVELIAIAQPDIIVFGGSVGRYFNQFQPFLAEDLSRNHNPLLTMPLLQEAARPEEAVLYGCYDLARETYGTTT